MSDLSELSNPYASPAADDFSETVAAPAALPRTAEVWTATLIILCIACGLAMAAGWILLAWVDHTYPAFGLQINHADQLAQFATGASNAIIMAGLVCYGQYHAVICRDVIWSRSIALLLMIASLVVALGGLLMFLGSTTMLLMLVPATLGATLSLMMFRWYSQLYAFRRQQRRSAKRL